MTRKDYVLIAQTLAQFTGDSGDVIDRDAMAYDLADALAQDNPRFDRERFLVASGVWEKCDYCTARASAFSTSKKWSSAHKGKGLIKSEKAVA
jgi:hypothetical protein